MPALRGQVLSRRKGPSATVQQSGTIRGIPNVEFTREELRLILPMYQIVDDCIAGEHAIKKRRYEYLPMPNKSDQSQDNLDRYEAYIQRAVFYNVTRRTVFALKGQIFMRDPQVDVPTSLEVLNLDATGENVTLEQVADSLAEYIISIGRAGIHVDFPTTGEGATKQQLDDGDIRPVIVPYNGREIVNWRKALRGARSVYTLIVVREDYTTGDDGFEAKTESQYKVMRLQSAQATQDQLTETYGADFEDMFGMPMAMAQSSNKDIYVLEIWRGNGSAPTNTGGTYSLAQRYYPTDSNGQFLNEIPWMFVGSEKNDDSIDHPPMYDMAKLDISHYRNSADFEEACFLVGQPTPVVSGVTEEWNANVLKGSIQLGSRGVIPLPLGGTALLLQASENTLPEKAMDRKERQMVALGAKLVEQRQVQRTATEAQMEGTADTSILATIAQNVSVAVEWALKKACVFTGDNPDAVSFILNTEFDLTRMDPAERQQLLLEWQGAAIAFTEMRANLRRGGIATLDDAEAEAMIQKEEQIRQEAALEQMAANAKINLQAVQEGGAAPPAGGPGATGATGPGKPPAKPAPAAKKGA